MGHLDPTINITMPPREGYVQDMVTFLNEPKLLWVTACPLLLIQLYSRVVFHKQKALEIAIHIGRYFI